MNPGNELYGLVMAGGESSRMGTDKSMLKYYGQPQRYYVYKMVQKLCKKVFISCNLKQSAEIPDHYQKIIDSNKYAGSGPVSGLLSAFEAMQDTNFLVVGCDYPFLTIQDLLLLLQHQEDHDLAVTYFNAEQNIREPLLGIYKSSCYPILFQQYKEGNYSLNYFLKSINAVTIAPVSQKSIQSIDNPDDYKKAFDMINPQKA